MDECANDRLLARLTDQLIDSLINQTSKYPSELQRNPIVPTLLQSSDLQDQQHYKTNLTNEASPHADNLPEAIPDCKTTKEDTGKHSSQAIFPTMSAG